MPASFDFALPTLIRSVLPKKRNQPGAAMKNILSQIISSPFGAFAVLSFAAFLEVY
jgi:hypothetical protein